MTVGTEIYHAIKEHYSVSTPQESLDARLRGFMEAGSYAVEGGRDLYMEVMDMTTGLAWMSAAPVELSDFEALTLEDPLVKVGIAHAAMDRAVFQYSPEAPELPVREKVIDGRVYINVAAPLEQTPPSQSGGPIEITVNKAHVLGFEAGRSLAVLSLPEGDFIEVVGQGGADDSLVLPANGVLKRLTLSESWVVSLPTPTRTFFWFDPSMRSFQGPVSLPSGNGSVLSGPGVPEGGPSN